MSTDDVVNKLERFRSAHTFPFYEDGVLREAAAEIVRLRGEVEAWSKSYDRAVELGQQHRGRAERMEVALLGFPKEPNPYTYRIAYAKAQDALRAADNRDAAGVWIRANLPESLHSMSTVEVMQLLLDGGIAAEQDLIKAEAIAPAEAKGDAFRYPPSLDFDEDGDPVYSFPLGPYRVSVVGDGNKFSVIATQGASIVHIGKDVPFTPQPADGGAVAWLIDWPDEPDLGHYFADGPSDSGRSRPLYTHPPAAQVQQPGRAHHCQNGRADVCLASQRDGVICPEESCDIDDGMRSDHTKAAHPSACELGAVSGEMVQAAAAAIANARAGRRGVPTMRDVLSILPGHLLAEVTEDARAALTAALQHRGDSRGGEG